ncbi:MAG: hypothetical protein NTW03_02910, partial [Verrucomicrobia bacterium]|nr:hypothetical protein [Verrucomicrobiota bacterium]
MKTRNRPFLSLLIRLGSITFAVLAGLLGARADIGSIRIDKPLDRRGWNQKWLIPEGAFYLSTPLATKLFVQIRKERTGEFWDPFGAFHMNVPPWDESINMPVKDYGITWGGTWNYAYLIDDYIGGYPPMRSNLEPGAYTVFAWIEYGIGGKAEADPVTFTVDYIEPTVSFTSPANKDAFNYFPMVYQGNSYDPPYKGASGNISGSGIFLVEFRLMRVSDGKYFQWNQTSEALWSDHTNETRAQRSETFWTIKDEFPASFASNMGVFQIEARAGDSALNWSPWKVARFKVEKTPPDCLILSPTNGVPVSELNLVSGEIEDDPDGGGLGRVTLALQRQADGLWWDGSTWGPTEYENGVSLTYYWGGVQPRRVTWNKKLDLPAGFNLPNGNYLLSIRAYDRAENMTNVLQVVTVNKIIPSLTIDSPTNGAVLKWSWPSFTGSAIPAPGRQIVSMNMLLTRKFRDSSISPLRYAAWNGFNWVESSNPVISWLNLSWGPAIWGCYGPFPMGSDLRSGEYSILLTAVDNNGAQGEARSQFWVDIDPPATFYIDEPGDTAVLRALPGIGGQTEDGVNGSGIDRVLMQLYRLDPIPGGGTTAVGWNGSVWTPQGYNLQTRVEDYRWECMDNLPQGQDLPNGSYMVLAAALDRAGHMSSQESIGVEVMKTPPDLTTDAPADRYMTHFSEIRGTMTPGTNRFPIVSTELILWRQSDLAFWDGAAWVGSKAMLSVLRSSMDSNWVCGSALPSGSNLRDD